MKRFSPYFKLLLPVKWYFLTAIVAGIIYGISTGLGVPLILDKVLPILFNETPNQDLILFETPSWLGTFQLTVPAQWTLVFAVSLLPITFAIRGISGFTNVYWINYCGLHLLEKIRVQVFERLQALDLKFFHKNQSGDLLSRITTDTNQVQMAVVAVANDLVKQPVTLLGAIGVIVWKIIDKPNLGFVIVGLVVIPICIFPIRHVGKRLYKKAKQFQQQNGDLSAHLAESLQSPMEVRAYNLQDYQITSFRGLVQRLFGFRMKVIKYTYVLSPIIEFIAAFGISYTIYKAAKSGVVLEDILALVVALYMAYEPVKKLGSIHNIVKQGTAALERLEYILDHSIETEDIKNPKPLTHCQGAVHYDAINFSYDEKEPVLKEINFAAKPGEVVALVGPSGAGKSTFIHLMPRFFPINSGKITLDGTDINEVSKEELRNNIAIVSQAPVLFNDTLYNNIRLGRQDASREEIEAAARAAYADEFIRAFPEGYETLAGEQGSRLSGGQKQRIALARAFLKNAPILILDEATSALDSESEAKIKIALQELIQGKTTFIIAHRLGTIKHADTILVFEKGEIVERGNHETLMREGTLYPKLYDA